MAKIRLLAKKVGKEFLVKKEELTFPDGHTEIRVGYYTLDGKKYLGSLKQAREYVESQKAAVQKRIHLGDVLIEPKERRTRHEKRSR